MSATDSASRAGARSPMAAFARRWPIAVLAALVGVGLGLLAAASVTTTYTAEARVAVGYGDLTSGAIAGFPTAASELASNYARYINDQGLSGSTYPGVRVTASPIPDSNVVRVEGRSADADAAIAAVTGKSRELVELVNNPAGADSPDALLAEYTEISAKLAAAQANQKAAQTAYDTARADPLSTQNKLVRLRQRLIDASATTAAIDLRHGGIASDYVNAEDSSQSADLVLIQEGQLTADDSSARQQRYGVLGLVLGLGVALVVAVALERRQGARRPRAGAERDPSA